MRWWVDERDNGPPSRYMVIGSIAHEMLRHLIDEGRGFVEGADFDALFERSMSGLRLQALAAGLTDDDLPAIREDLAEHFVRLRAWTDDGNDKTRGRMAERARFSGRYGLEGRLDLSVVDDDRLRIVELKTGRFESPAHVRQVRCYTLMWDLLAKAEGRAVEGWLLYSKTGKQKQVRRRSHEEERGVVHARNDVVALRRWLSDADTSYRPPGFEERPELCGDQPCKYRKERCAQQQAIVGHPSGLGIEDAPVDPTLWAGCDPELVRAARHHYFHFVRLVEREYRAASRAMGDTFRASDIARRVADQEALAGGVIREIDAKTGRVELQISNRGVIHVGDEVMVHRGDFETEPSMLGRVRAADREHLVIACEAAELVASLPVDGWVVDRRVLRIGYRDMHRALYRFIAESPVERLERVVMPQRRSDGGQRALAIGADDAGPTEWATGDDRTLNAAQRRAIERGLEARDALLIQGPPGTGKTTVIAELVAQLVARGDRVLLAAATNTAVDTALGRVVQAGVTDVLRVGHSHRAPMETRDAFLAADLDPSAHYTNDLEQLVPSLARLGSRVAQARVIAATTNACASSPLFDILDPRGAHTPLRRPPPFDVVVVDEASQLTEPLALAALLRGARFVLVGDDLQLPPVVTAPEATSAHVGEPDTVSLAEAGVRGLDQSLFERLKPHVSHVLLTTQYRMSADVQRFPAGAFYGDRLRAHASAATRTFPERAGLSAPADIALDPAVPLVWLDVGGDAEGRTHAAEAEAAAKVAIGLAERARDGAQAVGVISPFRAQCRAIRAALVRQLGADAAAAIEVDTVERFQGREKEALVVSFVARSWSDFVMDRRRLNVTLTRARTKIVLLGSAEVATRLEEVFGVPLAAQRDTSSVYSNVSPSS